MQRQVIQQQKTDNRELDQQEDEEEEELEEEIEEVEEEMDEDASDSQTDSVLPTIEEREFLPPAPPALQKPDVAPSHRHDILDLSADELYHNNNEQEDGEVEEEEQGGRRGVQ